MENLSPGVWHEIFREAAHATTVVRMAVFLYFFGKLNTLFKTGEVIEPEGDTNVEVLHWLWDLHNEFNVEDLSWTEMEEMYLQKQPCNVFCTDDGSNSVIIKYGPGIWKVIHIEAGSVGSVYETAIFVEHMYDRVKQFPCGVCKGHFEEYIAENPPEDAEQTNEGLLYWTFLFHNAVNERLGKGPGDWEEIKRWFIVP